MIGFKELVTEPIKSDFTVCCALELRGAGASGEHSRTAVPNNKLAYIGRIIFRIHLHLRFILGYLFAVLCFLALFGRAVTCAVQSERISEHDRTLSARNARQIILLSESELLPFHKENQMREIILWRKEMLAFIAAYEI